MTEREEIYGEDITPPISVTGTPCLDATWLATDAEARAKLLTTKVITCSNLAALGADDTFAGFVELATNAEAQAKALATRALTPANLAALNATDTMSGLVEKATAAELESGTADKYPDASQLLLRRVVATGALLGGDLTGNPRGFSAIDIQASRAGPNFVAYGSQAICIGNNALALAAGIAIGAGVNAGNYGGISIGNSATSGTVGIAIGSSCYGGYRSVAIGGAATASGYRSVAIGEGPVATKDYSVALGYNTKATCALTLNTLPICIRKDDGEAASSAFSAFGGAEVVLLSKEVNLEAAGDQTITFPIGVIPYNSFFHFYPDEVGIIATRVVGGVVTQPTVRFGWTGTPAGLVAAVLCTALNAAFTRQRFTTLLNYNGQTSLIGGITAAGSGGTYFGRFYFKGLLIEDE